MQFFKAYFPCQACNTALIEIMFTQTNVPNNPFTAGIFSMTIRTTEAVLKRQQDLTTGTEDIPTNFTYKATLATRKPS